MGFGCSIDPHMIYVMTFVLKEMDFGCSTDPLMICYDFCCEGKKNFVGEDGYGAWSHIIVTIKW